MGWEALPRGGWGGGGFPAPRVFLAPPRRSCFGFFWAILVRSWVSWGQLGSKLRVLGLTCLQSLVSCGQAVAKLALEPTHIHIHSTYTYTYTYHTQLKVQVIESHSTSCNCQVIERTRLTRARMNDPTVQLKGED